MSILRRLSFSKLRLNKIRGGGDKGSFFSEGKNEPTGYLFNETPPPPGTQRKWELWEAPWYLCLGASILILTLGFPARPDSSLVKWAERQALEKSEDS